MNNWKLLSRWIFISIGITLFLILSATSYKFIKKINQPDVMKCGVITHKLGQDRRYKHHISTELYLGIKYDDNTFDAVYVDVKSYMQKNIGDRVCLKQEKQFTKYESIGGLFLLTMGVVIFLIIFYYFLKSFNLL